jgi:hypothetical protein
VSEALDQISTRLRELAAELESEADEERAAELVREASELATRAGQAVEEALRAGAAEAAES